MIAGATPQGKRHSIFPMGVDRSQYPSSSFFSGKSHLKEARKDYGGK
jgi:hypothetical protein